MLTDPTNCSTIKNAKAACSKKTGSSRQTNHVSHQQMKTTVNLDQDITKPAETTINPDSGDKSEKAGAGNQDEHMQLENRNTSGNEGQTGANSTSDTSNGNYCKANYVTGRNHCDAMDFFQTEVDRHATFTRNVNQWKCPSVCVIKFLYKYDLPE